MNETVGRYSKSVEELRQQITDKFSEVRKLLGILNTLEEMDGLPKTDLGQIGISVQEGVSISDSVSVTLIPAKATSAIRLDEYLGLLPLDAAKKYLKNLKTAASLDDIAVAIERGGAAVSGSDWKDELDRSLLRSTTEVVKVREKVYGLAEFYSAEQLTNLRKTRRQRPKDDDKKPKRKKGNRRKSSGRRKTNTKATVKSEQQLKPQPLLPEKEQEKVQS
jgi:hypothetical protein